MRFTSAKKAVVALSAAGATLLLMANPASAAVTRTATFDTTSSLTLHPGNGSADIVIAFDGVADVCDTGATSYIDLGLDDPSNGLVDLDAADYHLATGTFTSGANNFQATIVGNADTTGTISTTATGAVSVGVNAKAILKNCDGTGAALCTTSAITMTLAGTHNTTAAGGTRIGTASVAGSTATNGIQAPLGTCSNTLLRALLNNAEADLDLDLTLS